VGSVVAAFYYLRLIKVMWFDTASGATDRPPIEARLIAVGLALFCFPAVWLALKWIYPAAGRAAHAFGLA
jgi:NADH-quinone oxidoreductase subunit N